ncbi:Hsp70 family protein, partial [bacterium AH-315-K03]|nr:Hsp70 family protein [bacterium AH-315-K03]
VAFREGEWLFGEAAKNHLWVNPDQAVASIKRKMDDAGYRVELGGQSLSPIDISAKILRALVDAGEEQLGCAIKDAVITVPAWFQETQRQATLAAGQQAGLNVIQIINEPTAAAIAHQQIPVAEGEEEKWLVYDLGGGTFDVSILNVTHASYEVLSSLGNTYLGGDDFDHRLTEKFIAHLRDQHNVNPDSDNTAKTRLQLLAEQTKVRLSSEVRVHVEEPVVINGESCLLDIEINRNDFEQLIDDLVSSTEEKALQALNEAGVQADSVQRLLLVGGSTRIPCIAERLEQRFGIEPESWLDPDLSVALGACVRGAISNNQSFERSVVDICPHSLGVAVYGELDHDQEMLPMDMDMDMDEDCRHPLTFSPLIRRNSRLPASFVRTFFKNDEQQEQAIVAVYQGENNNTRHNTFIGEFIVDLENNLDRQLDIQFAYDINGTINISVKEAGTHNTRVYSMDLSRSSESNSELSGFSSNIIDQNDSTDDDVDSNVTNFLIESVNKRLAEQNNADSNDIRALLESYQSLLGQDNDDELDDIEESLYDWIEGD